MSNYASALLLGMADSMAEPEPFPVEPLTLGELVWPPVPASADAIGLVVGITVADAVGRVCAGDEDTLPLSVLLTPQPQSIAASSATSQCLALVSCPASSSLTFPENDIPKPL